MYGTAGDINISVARYNRKQETNRKGEIHFIL